MVLLQRLVSKLLFDNLLFKFDCLHVLRQVVKVNRSRRLLQKRDAFDSNLRVASLSIMYHLFVFSASTLTRSIQSVDAALLCRLVLLKNDDVLKADALVSAYFFFLSGLLMRALCYFIASELGNALKDALSKSSNVY